MDKEIFGTKHRLVLSTPKYTFLPGGHARGLLRDLTPNRTYVSPTSTKSIDVVDQIYKNSNDIHVSQYIYWKITWLIYWYLFLPEVT
jgi:hypothetical protein